MRRFALLLAALVAPLAGCDGNNGTTPGCAAGDRSRCISQVAVGSHFACALLADHTVWCWGRNDESQLGYATTDLCPENLPNGQTQSVACHTFPFQVLGLDHVTHLATGDAFACAIRDDGTVRCWGANESGELGNGTTTPSQAPVTVTGVSNASAIAAGARHACAATMNGVMCWGADERGQLGLANAPTQCGSTACATSAVVVAGTSGVVDIAAGAAHTCARTMAGAVLCWGDDNYGQLGNGMGNAMPLATPQAVRTGSAALVNVQAIAAGGDHTCAVRMDGAVYCWGRDDHGEIGSASHDPMMARCAGACVPVAVAVPGLPGAPSPMDGIDAGAGGDAGMRDGGTTHMDAGAVRDVMMPSISMPTGVSAGSTFSCAILGDATVRCWGDDSQSQLGDGVPSAAAQPPSIVIAGPGAAVNNPLQSVMQVASGASSTCALVMDGSLHCWGSNQDGALGIGNTSSPSGPVPVTW